MSMHCVACIHGPKSASFQMAFLCMISTLLKVLCDLYKMATGFLYHHPQTPTMNITGFIHFIGFILQNIWDISLH